MLAKQVEKESERDRSLRIAHEARMKYYYAKPNESERDRSRRTIAIARNRSNILYNHRIDTRIIQDGRRRPRNEEIFSVMKLLAFREKWGRSPRFFRYKIESNIGCLRIFYVDG